MYSVLGYGGIIMGDSGQAPKTEEAPRSIHQILSSLDNVIARSEKNMQELTNRLGPILTNSAELSSDEKEVVPPRQGSSEISSMLCAYIERIELVNIDILRMEERLEV